MNPASAWSYAGGDSCCEFFTQCLKASPIDVPADARVLEIGCAEFDWLTPASQTWPGMTFDGIDWRDSGKPVPRVTRMKGDVRDPNHYPPGSFDWIVSISAIEHIGLGHYKQDPKDVDGDTVALANAVRWLKPGGWLLFDVPYNPERYVVHGTSHREYDDDAIWTRLWVEPLARAKATARWHGTYYCHAKATTHLIEKPTSATTPFYYVGFAWQKVG
jgi:SAM-dependent methyltransferase